jgi:hypothetical protein
MKRRVEVSGGHVPWVVEECTLTNPQCNLEDFHCKENSLLFDITETILFWRIL